MQEPHEMILLDLLKKIDDLRDQREKLKAQLEKIKEPCKIPIQTSSS